VIYFVAMYFMVTFHIESAPGHDPADITQRLREGFAMYPHVEALPTSFVVQVAGYGKYEAVQKRLLDLAAQENVPVRFVMSPLMQRGLYHGRMSREAAESINRIAE